MFTLKRRTAGLRLLAHIELFCQSDTPTKVFFLFLRFGCLGLRLTPRFEILGVSGEVPPRLELKSKMNTYTATQTARLSPSVGVMVVNEEMWKHNTYMTTVTSYDLNDEDHEDGFSLCISHDVFDNETNEIVDGKHSSKTVFMSREALLMFAREVLNKFDN
jgi:hypothetical protein